MRQTTVGWKFRVKWKDDTVIWTSLQDLKEYNPVEIAEYVTSRDIESKPAFAWWVPFTLRKRDSIITGVKSRVSK